MVYYRQGQAGYREPKRYGNLPGVQSITLLSAKGQCNAIFFNNSNYYYYYLFKLQIGFYPVPVALQ
jgi:hypothetical protein